MTIPVGRQVGMSTNHVIAFARWVAEHPDIGDSLTAVEREKLIQRLAREALAADEASSTQTSERGSGHTSAKPIACPRCGASLRYLRDCDGCDGACEGHHPGFVECPAARRSPSPPIASDQELARGLLARIAGGSWSEASIPPVIDFIAALKSRTSDASPAPVRELADPTMTAEEIAAAIRGDAPKWRPEWTKVWLVLEADEGTNVYTDEDMADHDVDLYGGEAKATKVGPFVLGTEPATVASDAQDRSCRCTWGEMGEMAAVMPGCPLHDREKPLTAREAARQRIPLGVAEVQALEGALQMADGEIAMLRRAMGWAEGRGSSRAVVNEAVARLAHMSSPERSEAPAGERPNGCDCWGTSTCNVCDPGNTGKRTVFASSRPDYPPDFTCRLCLAPVRFQIRDAVTGRAEPGYCSSHGESMLRPLTTPVSGDGATAAKPNVVGVTVTYSPGQKRSDSHGG